MLYFRILTVTEKADHVIVPDEDIILGSEFQKRKTMHKGAIIDVVPHSKIRSVSMLLKAIYSQ